MFACNWHSREHACVDLHTDLESILDKPPKDAVNPDPEGHQLVGTLPKSLDREPIKRAFGPESGKHSRSKDRDEDCSHQGPSRWYTPEWRLLCAARKEREEVGKRHLKVYHRNDFSIFHGRESELSKGAGRIV